MDWYTNFELMSADERQRGTAESLRFLDETMKQAGIQPDDPVEIVGHSQGGIIAAAAATDFQDKYDIQHIATLGSPIANFEIPEKTRVTAIEMDDEGIAALDGEANPHTENWLTIRCSVHEEDAPKRAFPGAEVSDSSRRRTPRTTRNTMRRDTGTPTTPEANPCWTMTVISKRSWKASWRRSSIMRDASANDGTNGSRLNVCCCL